MLILDSWPELCVILILTKIQEGQLKHTPFTIKGTKAQKINFLAQTLSSKAGSESTTAWLKTCDFSIAP